MPRVSSLAVSTVTLIFRPSNSSGLSSQAMTQGSCSGRAFAAVLLEVEMLGEADHVRHRLAGLVADGGERLDAVGEAEHAVGHVERDHGDRHAAPQHDVGGLGIDIDVELGSRGDVADLEIGARHHHDLADPRRDVGSLDQRHADVGERPEGAERDRSRLLAAQRVDDVVDAVLRLERLLRLRQVGAVEPGRPVDMLGGDQHPAHRPLAAGIDRHLRAAGELDHLQRIPGILGEADIAADRDDAEDVELLRRGQGEEDRDGVVLAGVGVDDDLARHGCPRSPAAAEAADVGGDPSRFRRRRYPRRRSPGPR